MACIRISVDFTQNKARQADVDALRLAIQLVEVDIDQCPNSAFVLRTFSKGFDLALGDLYRLAQLQQGFDVAGNGFSYVFQCVFYGVAPRMDAFNSGHVYTVHATFVFKNYYWDIHFLL